MVVALGGVQTATVSIRIGVPRPTKTHMQCQACNCCKHSTAATRQQCAPCTLALSAGGGVCGVPSVTTARTAGCGSESALPSVSAERAAPSLNWPWPRKARPSQPPAAKAGGAKHEQCLLSGCALRSLIRYAPLNCTAKQPQTQPRSTSTQAAHPSAGNQLQPTQPTRVAQQVDLIRASLQASGIHQILHTVQVPANPCCQICHTRPSCNIRLAQRTSALLECALTWCARAMHAICNADQPPCQQLTRCSPNGAAGAPVGLQCTISSSTQQDRLCCNAVLTRCSRGAWCSWCSSRHV